VADAASDDDEYDGCFNDGAEVIVSSAAEAPASRPGGAAGQASEQEGAVVPADGDASPAPSEGAPVSSQGSELGSDLDDSEFDEPDTENVLYAEVAKVSKERRKWTLHLKHGVLMANGTECLFSSGKGVFEVEEGATEATGALEDEAQPDAVLADAI